MKEEGPLVFDIRHFALDDGPGMRTTVFLKGCPLSCVWCHNPESIDPVREVGFHPVLCVGCGECEKTCPRGAVDMKSEGRIRRDLCDPCGACADACPATALWNIGVYYPPRVLSEILLRDRIFCQTSSGGVTFSGGEPAFSMDHVAQVASDLKRHGIHVALQTSGMFDLAQFRERLLPLVDLIYYDIKLVDPEEHVKWTGVRNNRIIENFLSLSREEGVSMVPRVPLVPGITSTARNLTGIARLFREAGMSKYELLPYNSGGMGKRRIAGKETPEALNMIRWDGETEEKMGRVFAAAFAG